jgi:hypothetical protein
MQVVIEEEEHFIARASQKYEITEIEGKDGAIFDELGYSIVERPIYVQCLNINKIDDILAWLNGEGEFEYKGRKTTARFYSQLEPQRSSCIRIIDTTFIRDPFWNKANEDYQLVKDRKDKQASGEYIHVEDSSNCRAKIGIGGNQKQEARSGKNLLELMEGTYSNNGITAVVKNGIVTLNGTAKAISFVGINLLKSIELTNDKAYHLSAFNEKTVGDNTNYCSLRINQDNIQVLFNTANVNGSITTNLKISYITIRTAQGITYNNFVVKPQLELGAGTKEWEQGGASPSLDYPSPIKAVGSNINLFNKDNMTIGKIWNGATLLDSDVGNASPKIPVTAGKTYIRNAGYSSNYIIKENNSVVDVQGGTNAITMPEDAKYWMFNIPKDIDINTIKAEEGSISTPQSKYGQGSVKVTKCNKNLLNSSILENKILDSKTGSATTNTSWKASDFIQINSGIYNFSWKSSSNYFQVTICFYDRNKNFLSGISWAIANVYSKSFEVDENTTFIRVSYSTIISGKEANREKIILEQNSTETDYEQHEEQSYIIPVQSEMLEGDYFDFDNEEEVHVWGNVIVNGTETINKNSNSEFFSITKSMSQFDTSATGIEQSISNYGTGTTLALGSGNTNNKYSFNASTIYLDCYNSNINTVEKLKVQLTKNNMKIYAKLATPTRLKFTDKQKAVAKELNNARTYKNVTNITTDSKAKLSLDYFTVTDETIKNEGNIQSRPVLRLEKTVSEAVEITINNVRFKYNFNNDTYVEIDCENKTVEYEGINRNRNLFISYDFPKLNIGSNNIIMNDGDCIIKVIRKDRWL